jgi:release factor glutamine methyltransferase
VTAEDAAPTRTPTVAVVLDEAAERLAAAGIETAGLDAELLLRHVTGWDRARVVASGDRPLSAGDAQAFRAFVAERALRRPLQHLTGVQAFWRHEFRVTPAVLIPRPETEILVEAAIARLRPLARPRVVDVGTGSACIALSLAAELPNAIVHATDVSASALAVARDNARRLGLADRVRFHQGDLLAPIVAAGARADLVAANPPYVDEREWETLAPEVRDHEPPLALVAPEGRERLYARLAEAAAAVLEPGGSLLLEMGRGMEAEVAAACTAAGLRVQTVLPDLQGIARVVVATRA